MPDFLSRLIRRSFKQADAIRPRPASVFASTVPAGESAFHRATERDAVNEPPRHRQDATRPRTAASPHTGPEETEISRFEEKRKRAGTPAPARPKATAASNGAKRLKSRPPKAEDPGAESVEAMPTRDETEEKASPSHKESRRSNQQARPVAVTPSKSEGDARKEGGTPHYAGGPPREDVAITPSAESIAAPLKAAYPKHVEPSGPAHAPHRIVAAPAGADQLAGSVQASASTHQHDGGHGVADRRSVGPIGTRPHLAAFSAQAGWVPMKPAERRAAPPSVNVTIGRLEVKANLTREARPPRPSEKPSGVMTLNQYLSRSGQGGRG